MKAEGNFTSLDYPQPYPNNVNCVWRISTDPLRRIALGTRDKEFEVESGSTRQSCNYDYVSVRDGTSENSPELGRFCGEPNSLQALHTIYSTTSHMYVQFTSDYIQRKKGFHLQYKTFYAGQSVIRYFVYIHKCSKHTHTHKQVRSVVHMPDLNCPREHSPLHSTH